MTTLRQRVRDGLRENTMTRPQPTERRTTGRAVRTLDSRRVTAAGVTDEEIHIPAVARDHERPTAAFTAVFGHADPATVPRKPRRVLLFSLTNRDRDHRVGRDLGVLDLDRPVSDFVSGTDATVLCRVLSLNHTAGVANPIPVRWCAGRATSPIRAISSTGPGAPRPPYPVVGSSNSNLGIYARRVVSSAGPPVHRHAA